MSIRLDQSIFSSSHILRHAGVSPKAMGAQCLDNGNGGPLLNDNHCYTTLHHGRSVVDDGRSIGPTTTDDSCRDIRSEHLLITLLNLQLSLFATRSHVLSLRH